LDTCIPHGEFAYYTKELQLTSMDALLVVGSGAFENAQSPASSLVDLSESSYLEEVNNFAFANYPGKIKMRGRFHRLWELGYKAFTNTTNVDNDVAIECVAEGGLAIRKDAFLAFKGTRNSAGESLACSPLSYDSEVSTWTFPLNAFGAADTSVTSTGTNPGQWTCTIHEDAVRNAVVSGTGRLSGTQVLMLDGVGKSSVSGQHMSVDGGTTVGGAALSVCSWVRWGSFGFWSKIVDFGNGDYNNNIILANYQSTSTLTWTIFRGSTYKDFRAADALELNKWTYICASVELDGTMHLFKNGLKLKCTSGKACDTSGEGSKGWTPDLLLRSNSYIGRANWDNNNYLHGWLADLTVIDGHAVTTEAEVKMKMAATGTTSTTTNVITTSIASTISHNRKVAGSGTITPSTVTPLNISVVPPLNISADVNVTAESPTTSGTTIAITTTAATGSSTDPDQPSSTVQTVGIVVGVVVVMVLIIIALLYNRKKKKYADQAVRHCAVFISLHMHQCLM
jgi:hypothetical protein